MFDSKAWSNFLNGCAEFDKVRLHHNLLKREKSNTHTHRPITSPTDTQDGVETLSSHMETERRQAPL